uniref:Putative transcription factor grauzone-like protein n=1 Tax=Lutzomyia longipalpis TaxID=7200 RepID=A0A1B0CE69_LUTLO
MTTKEEIIQSTPDNTPELSSGVNVNDLCRLCLNASSNKIEIFGSIGLQMNISGTIWILFNSQVLQNDSWPQSVCMTCCEKLTEFHGFHSTVKSTEATLVGLCGPLVKEETSEEVQDSEEPVPEDAVEVVLKEKAKREKKKKTPVKARKRTRTKETSGKAGRPRVSPKFVPSEEFTGNFDGVIIEMNCEVCSETLPDFMELKKHFREKHNQEGYVKCCNLSLKNNPELLEHMHYHRDPSQFKCHVCGKIYRTQKYLQFHLQRHTAPEEYKYQCNQCQKRFATRNYLFMHKRVHIPKGARKTPCPKCNKILSSAHTMKMHVERVHEKRHRRMCEICARVFNTIEGFKIHQKKHKGLVVNEKMECDVCGKTYSCRQGLRRHKQIHEITDEVFSCDVCSKEFQTRRRMMAHKKHVHSDKSFKCHLCDRVFKHALNLREHVASHSGQQSLYNCNFCDKMFNSNANKYVHQKRNHPEEWEDFQRKKEQGEEAVAATSAN